MSWRNILKNYKPLAHGVKGDKAEGKRKGPLYQHDYVDPGKYAPKGRGEPISPEFQTNFGTSRVDYEMNEPTKMGDTYGIPSLASNTNVSLTNPDGSPRTVSQFLEEKTPADPMDDLLLNMLRQDGKNPDTMTLQEYEKYRKEKYRSRKK